MASTCPICLIVINGPEDDIGESFQLSCSHYIHSECSKGLKNTLCPICRRDVVWPSDIEKSITQNKNRYEEELQVQQDQLVRQYMVQQHLLKLIELQAQMNKFESRRKFFGWATIIVCVVAVVSIIFHNKN